MVIFFMIASSKQGCVIGVLPFHRKPMVPGIQ